ncbi:MAG: hypothetical protein ACO1PI_10420 [Bacteroidota bacterium]
MNIYNLNSIKDYFGDRLKPFSITDEVKEILPKLSHENKMILFEIGIPETHDGYAGVYTKLEELSLHKSKYIRLYTRDFEENYFSIFLDTETDIVVYHFEYEGSKKQYSHLNSSVLIFLEFWKVYEIFSKKFDILGMKEYYNNKKKYTDELREEFEKINKEDTNASWWGSLLEEMEYGPL